MNEKIIAIIKDRLELQSVKRLLGDFYKLPKITYAYIDSDTFIKNDFSKWNNYKKQGFAKAISGNFTSNYSEVVSYLNNKITKE